MSMQVTQCVTLAELREQVLGLRQDQIAQRAGCSQSWVCLVERGELPRKASKTWPALIEAYRLDGREEQFVRLVRNAARLKALRRHIAEDFPLQLFAHAEADGLVIGLPDALLKPAEGRIVPEAEGAA